MFDLPRPTPFEAALVGRPETRLLVAALHADAPAGLGAEVGRAAGVDWAEVLALAARHRVLPLVARTLGAEPAVPAAVRERIRRAALTDARRQLGQTAALRDVLDALDAAGLASLPLKGPALSAWLYGDPARRTSRDIDVLVRPADIAAAVAAVRRIGFDAAFGEGERLLSPGEAAVVAREFAFKEAVSVDPRRQVVLELHWRPFRDPGLRRMAAAMSAGLRRAHGPGVPAVGPEAAVLAHVLVHGALHGYRRLTWLADAAALTRRADDGTWAHALALARADGVEPAALLGPFLAGRLLGADLPASVAERVAARERRLRRLADGCPALAPDDDSGAARTAAACYDRPADRLRHAWRRATRPTERELGAADLGGGAVARVGRRFARPLGVLARALRRTDEG